MYLVEIDNIKNVSSTLNDAKYTKKTNEFLIDTKYEHYNFIITINKMLIK